MKNTIIQKPSQCGQTQEILPDLSGVRIAKAPINLSADIMEHGGLVISVAQRRIMLSLVIREADIVRFAMRDPWLSQDEINDLTGIPDFPGRINSVIPETSAERLEESNGWFATRTCSPEYFRDFVVSSRRGSLPFWQGVCNGYRAGVKMGEAQPTRHANDMADIYARRILSQLELSRFEGLRREHYKSDIGPMNDSVTMLKALINRAPTSYPESNNPLRALLDELGAHHETVVGLGDYIIHSEVENGYWSNILGWVENKDGATPFDSPDDIYLVPGSADAHVISFQRAPDAPQSGAKYRVKMA